jgi:pimeloyl-ACP methyl ester carboxylesterase
MAQALGERPQGELVLAFEYENSGAPLQEVARDLLERIRAAGINEGKPARAVAHSTGGLVARWLIERAGGEKIISQLIMLGTPNGGWPWPSLRSWATVALGCAMNGFHVAGWHANALGWLARAVASVDVISDQIGAGTDFVKELESGDAVAPPYVVIAGSASLAAAALKSDGVSEDRPLDRLMQRLSAAEALRGVKALEFFERENDMAVSLESMRRLPLRKAATEVLQVDSDHLSYFKEGEGLQRLRAVLARAVT